MWLPSTKPKFVYKYCSAPRATQILNDLTFFFAAAQSLNDLFEFRVLSLYTEDSETKFRVYAKNLITQGWFTDPDEALQAAKSIDIEHVDKTYAYFREQMKQTCALTMANSGVTCFTSEPNNQRMWGTYGVEHTGAVLEFSTDETRSKFASHLQPVIYTDTKLPICPSELISEQGGLNKRILGALFCAKHIHWKEEHEWRLLLLADSPQSTKDRIVPFEQKALTRAFLGPRISAEHEAAIRLAASKYRAKIPVFKREIDADLAEEHLVGVELIESSDQLKYWLQRPTRNGTD